MSTGQWAKMHDEHKTHKPLLIFCAFGKVLLIYSQHHWYSESVERPLLALDTVVLSQVAVRVAD